MAGAREEQPLLQVRKPLSACLEMKFMGEKIVSSLKKAFIAAAICLLPISGQAAEVTWRVPTSVPEGSPFYVNFLQRFAKNVDVMTEGRVAIEPYGAGVIVPALQVYDAVVDGTVEAGHSSPTYLLNKDPINGIFAGFPGGMGPEAFISWIYEGGGEKRLKELREGEGFHSMIVGIGSTEILAHSNVPIRSKDDLKGLKYRTSGPWAEVMRDYFEAVPTVVPAGETYTLLQRKGVDAVEWAPPSANLSEGFHQVAKYIVVPGVHQPSFLWEVVTTKETWDKLPDDLKAKLEAAAKLTTYEGLTNFYAADIKAMAEYRSGANEIITLSPEFVTELADAGRKWAQKKADEQKASGKPTMSEILADYLAFRDAWNKERSYLITE
ncbi:TRAP transporter substrate-binding protein DctP [Mycoplana ramosa]|uniref:TRAP transporter substrate-binding protein DctP n=1 Tax=Mycoplana ramosa TaxID=40837 RepID=A0ABW3YZ02_MYCRA